MVNLRRPPVAWREGEFSLDVQDPKEFYITGARPLFTLVVKNRSASKPFRGAVTVNWVLLRPDVATPSARVQAYDVPPGEERRYELPIEWHHLAGTALYSVTFPGAVGPDPLQAGGTHPLASYVVYDEGEFTKEQRERVEALDLSRRTLWAFYASVIASVFLGGATLVLTLVVLGVFK